MKTKLLLAISVSAILGMLASSCKYDEILPPPVDPGVQISFSEDVIPIFNASCNGAGCHNASGPAPDLRPVAAYESLWSGNYIDTIAPTDSELYRWMNGERGLPMPLQGTNASYVATVLLWIEQGAKDN